MSQRQDPQRVVHSFSSSPYSLSEGFWLAGCPRGGNRITVYYWNTALLSITSTLVSKALLSMEHLRYTAKTAGTRKKEKQAPNRMAALLRTSQSNRMVFPALHRMRCSRCQRTARESTTRSWSRPFCFKSSTWSRCVILAVDCSMIGPSSSASVT